MLLTWDIDAICDAGYLQVKEYRQNDRYDFFFYLKYLFTPKGLTFENDFKEKD